MERKPKFISGVHEAQGRRESMEDTHVLFDIVKETITDLSGNPEDSVAFYGVFDGHGGVDAAIMVQDNLHNNIFRSEAWKSGNIEGALNNGFETTDDQIIKQSIEKGWMNGSTAAVALFHNLSLYIANIGDSEALLIKKTADGQWEPEALTTLHKPSDPSEKERIEKLGGHVFFGRLFGALAVSRSFGDSKFKIPKTAQNFVSWEPAIKKVDIVPEQHKFLVLACDGLWDVMNHQQVSDFVIKARYEQNKNPAEISKMLVREALNKRTEDNVTAIVVCLDWGDEPTEPATSEPKLEHTQSNSSSATEHVENSPSSSQETSEPQPSTEVTDADDGSKTPKLDQ
jgi:protein phosphatase 2C family protein 2/3